MEKRIELIEGKDFTLSALVKRLNKKYKQKKSGKKFELGDIQQYVRRGFLPKAYGNENIEVIENDKIGIKVLRLSSKK